jgi:hypothetical protein
LLLIVQRMQVQLREQARGTVPRCCWCFADSLRWQHFLRLLWHPDQHWVNRRVEFDAVCLQLLAPVRLVQTGRPCDYVRVSGPDSVQQTLHRCRRRQH